MKKLWTPLPKKVFIELLTRSNILLVKRALISMLMFSDMLQCGTWNGRCSQKFDILFFILGSSDKLYYYYIQKNDFEQSLFYPKMSKIYLKIKSENVPLDYYSYFFVVTIFSKAAKQFEKAPFNSIMCILLFCI